MPTLSALSQRYGPLPPADLEWLQLLTGDWQVLSDLAFADLVLWLPTSDGGFVAVAQCRPSTGSTVYDDDVVGSVASLGQCAQLRAALDEQRPLRLRSSWRPNMAAVPQLSTAVIWPPSDRQPPWHVDFAVHEEVVPVVHDGRSIAVVSRHANVGWARTPSRLELNYTAAADDLVGMVARGEYPMPVAEADSGTPRVGDGMIRIDAEARVLYVSPNGLSCFHRLGMLDDPVGRSLITLSVSLVGREVEDVPLLSKMPWRVDVESNGVTVAVRGLPLTDNGKLTGAVLLCRDVSELRRRDRELVTKDATIREIHHRVKNSLQTVAALLRIQLRRVTSPDARAALAEAMRRVSTVAMVHETLTRTPDETVDFDDVVRQTLRLTADVTARESQVSTVLEGTFGRLCARGATALALVLTELVSNAVEHGFDDGESGTVRVIVDRDGDRLRIEVVDDGRGLTDDPGSGVGTQIVSTLVANELFGSISWRSGPEGGTSVVIQMEVRVSQEATVG